VRTVVVGGNSIALCGFGNSLGVNFFRSLLPMLLGVKRYLMWFHSIPPHARHRSTASDVRRGSQFYGQLNTIVFQITSRYVVCMLISCTSD
jgi:hypothetical protein